MTTRDRKITTTLLEFYQRPVAKVSLELFFSIITIIFFAFFAIRPTLLTMSNLVKEIDDKKILNQQLNQKIAALSTVQDSYNANQARFPVLDKAIPPTPRFDEAIAIIERAASDRGLLISSIQAKEIPKEPTQDVDFSQKTRLSKPILITVTGDYPTIRQFIGDLGNLQRTFIVNSIVFNINQERTGQQLEASITVDVPYFGVQQGVAVSPAPGAASAAPGK